MVAPIPQRNDAVHEAPDHVLFFIVGVGFRGVVDLNLLVFVPAIPAVETKRLIHVPNNLVTSDVVEAVSAGTNSSREQTPRDGDVRLSLGGVVVRFSPGAEPIAGWRRWNDVVRLLGAWRRW